MPRDLTNKYCECGRPAVAWTAGDYACQICADIQYQQVATERSEKLKALCKVHPSRRRTDETIKYHDTYRVVI